MLCPINFLVRIIWRQDRTLKSEEDKAIGNKFLVMWLRNGVE
jgi:hypothetical protein